MCAGDKADAWLSWAETKRFADSLHTGKWKALSRLPTAGPHRVLTRMLMSNINQFPFSPSVGTYATFSRLWHSIWIQGQEWVALPNIYLFILMHGPSRFIVLIG